MDEIKLKKLKRKAQNENNTNLLISVCTDLAELYTKQDRYDLAIEEYTILSDIHETQDNRIEYAKANRAIGEAYIGLLNFQKALKHHKLYLGVAISLDNCLEMQRAYATIGHTYLTWYLETQFDPQTTLPDAYKNFMKSLKIAESLKDIDKLEKVDMTARLFSNLGLVKESQGDYDSAMKLMNRSIELCKKHDIYEQLNRGYNSLASIFEKKKEYNEAISYYNHAIDAAKKLNGNFNLMSATLLAKSEALIKLSEFHSAKQVLLKAYKLKTPNLQDKKTIEKTLRVVASMCYTEDQVVISNDKKEMKNLYERLADGACYLKNYSKAAEYYKLMLQYAERSGASDRELAECYYSLAETYKDDGQYDKAVEYFEREYELCKSLKDNLNTLSIIADTKEAAGYSLAEVKAVYEKAINNCRCVKNLKEEKRMILRFIVYLRRHSHHIEAFQQEQYLNSLHSTDCEDESSSSDSEIRDSDSKVAVGEEINLDDLTDNSEDSDIENYQNNISDSPSVGKRKIRNCVVRKNIKGESQLHVACIKGTLPVVRHLLEQGHPVNIRDNSGWLPLHEACNYGYLEIVKLLLEKGAAINDRGGSHCGGVTPLYDAANNGHLKIVELLLDRGASVNSKTKDGDTPLNILKVFHNNTNFTGEQYELYKKLVDRMTKAMEKAGHKVENSITMTLPSLNGRDMREISPMDRNSEVSNTDDDDDDDDYIEDNICSKNCSEIDIADEYQKAIGNLRKKSTDFISKPRMQHSIKRSALIRDEEAALDDWLEDDIGDSRTKKRKTNMNSSLIVPTVKTRNRNSGSPKKSQSPKKRTSNPVVLLDEQEVCPVVMEIDSDYSPTKSSGRRTSGGRCSQNSKKKKHQVSLLDAGFSRRRSDTPPSSLESSTSQSSSIRRTNSFNVSKPKQTKLTTFKETRSFTETPKRQPLVGESTLAIPTSTEDLMVYVDVKVDDMTFRVPILLSQIQTNTIGWLAEQASLKYARKEYTKPTLELETTSGALLSDDDPLSLLFPMGAVQADPVIGRIVKLSLSSLVERYKDICMHSNINADESLCRQLEEMSISLNLQYKGYLSKSLAPLCKALNHQNSLLDLDLSGNFLDNDCVHKLCSSLPSLVNLTSLNLRCTGLLSCHLADIVKVFRANSNAVLEKLVNLDVSDNPLKDKCMQHLELITEHLKLKSLSLSNINLTRNIKSESEGGGVKLYLDNLELLDISDNDLDDCGIARFISWTNVSKLRSLDLSRNCADQSAVSYLANALEESHGNQLERLKLSRSNVQENELYTILRLCSKNLTHLDLSYNIHLTGISLRRILECPKLQEINIFGCDNILKYFEDCTGYNIFKSIIEHNVVLKLSANLQEYEGQIAILEDMFKTKYLDYYVEIGDNFLLLSSKRL